MARLLFCWPCSRSFATMEEASAPENHRPDCLRRPEDLHGQLRAGVEMNLEDYRVAIFPAQGNHQPYGHDVFGFRVRETLLQGQYTVGNLMAGGVHPSVVMVTPCCGAYYTKEHVKRSDGGYDSYPACNDCTEPVRVPDGFVKYENHDPRDGSLPRTLAAFLALTMDPLGAEILAQPLAERLLAFGVAMQGAVQKRTPPTDHNARHNNLYHARRELPLHYSGGLFTIVEASPYAVLTPTEISNLP